FGRIVSWERYVNGAGLAGRDILQLVLETRNEGIRADYERDILTATALECLAVNGPLEGNHDAVTTLSLSALGLGRVGAILLGKPTDVFIDVKVSDLGDHFFQLDGLEIGQCD